MIPRTLKQEKPLNSICFSIKRTTCLLRFLGRETIDTAFGKVRCLKLRPLVQSGRVFSEQESVTLWVSDDANKIPVKMRADLRVGSIDCDLENFKNLQHPFEIVLN